MIEGIGSSALGAVRTALQQGGAAQDGDGSAFKDVLQRALGSVEESQDRYSNVIERFLRNEDVDLYELTTTAQEAGIALEMLVDMRNKLVDAYRTIVSMQV